MTEENSVETAGRSSFLPILLLALVLLTQLIFQLVQLRSERNGLQELTANQQTPLEESQRMRAQLDGIAADTARLADQGNANAKAVIEELRRRGITINPDAGKDEPTVE